MRRRHVIAAFLAFVSAAWVLSDRIAIDKFAMAATPQTIASDKADTTTDSGKTSRADESLKQLLDGNERFVNGKAHSPRRTPDDFRALAKAQYPVAVIVGCSDSRVAPELLFDTGVGDLFVVRVAGNVVNGAGVTLKGSIEYAVAELNVPLIVVLGHSNCGAVKSAVAHIEHKDSLPGAINGLVELIKPAVAKAHGQPGDLVANSTRENINTGVETLKNLKPVLAPRVKDGSVKVVGAVYDLHTGKVELVPSDRN